MRNKRIERKLIRFKQPVNTTVALMAKDIEKPTSGHKCACCDNESMRGNSLCFKCTYGDSI
jgi:hypothetical protein